MKKFGTFHFLLIIILGACVAIPSEDGVATPIEITAEVSTVVAETPGPPPTEGPSPTVVPATQLPTLASGVSPTELKYRVLEEFPDFFFCDPDFYPVAREDELTLANQRFPELQANHEEFQTILSHNGLSGLSTFTDEQKMLIYREHKKLNAINFELFEDRYEFRIQTGQEGQQGSVITGTIDSSGSIQVLQREPAVPTCPICLAAGTLIETPRGPVPVEELRVGDPVWTQNESGQRVSASIIRTGIMKVPATHRMIHILLEDGRELWASPSHPTASGLRLEDLQIGDSLDGPRIIQLERVPYDEMYTFDILPSGSTGYYWANGILMGSTLAKLKED